jgi:hypothetical protein
MTRRAYAVLIAAPRVRLRSRPRRTRRCYENGAWVYHASNGIFPTSLGQIFTLASNTWMSGLADCTAWLQD